MSLMGYTEQDIRKMMASSSMFISMAPDEDIQDGLLMTIDFLQGLLEEGRV